MKNGPKMASKIDPRGDFFAQKSEKGEVHRTGFATRCTLHVARFDGFWSHFGPFWLMLVPFRSILDGFFMISNGFLEICYIFVQRIRLQFLNKFAATFSAFVHTPKTLNPATLQPIFLKTLARRNGRKRLNKQ